MNRNFALLATAAALALSSLSAHAGCVDPRVAAQTFANRMPPVLPLQKDAAMIDHHADGIVGTWQVSYTSNGSPGGDAFIQWHDDGTEWENIDFPVLGGNLCMGEWRQIDNRRVRRSHIGWLYTEGTISGYFTETETDTLARNGNSYSGVNDMKIYDLSGNLQAELPGTSDAVRFSP
ncbi:MAG TPA: hypothetical protein VHE32_08080 [Rhodanobacteraceae bacterium]|jgi:hypothetical protein|nr:hypothetical protein [Rhodanobacteraceae bacterium]